MPRFPIGVQIESKVSEAKQALQNIVDGFSENYDLAIKSSDSRNKIRSDVDSVITSEIYNAYTPEFYDRTYALLASFEVHALSESKDNKSELVVSSNPDIAAAKGDESLSYAAFFEDARFNTFIPASAKPIRPFMDQTAEAVFEVSSRISDKEAMKYIDRILRF